MNEILTAGGPVLWRRLDVHGHDAASLRGADGGAELRGMAVFHDEGGPTALHYLVRCDAEWQTTEAAIDGWSGSRTVQLRVQRTRAGGWTLNGVPCPAVAGCVDLDLSFTPATNLLPLRRLDLLVGQAAEVRSAWLEWPAAVLTPLVQRYARRSNDEYDYEADLPGTTKFAGVLRVEPLGWVLDYAGLWRAEGAV
ncbi:MAG: putative glycolipid-binding domain-containing protein [Gemmatimonadota bacterium]|nr:putative glycolipid-binding domain-containing protein [Gemmatimonadota bacterium]